MSKRIPIKTRAATEVADLILRLSRTAYADCAGQGMTQAQWIAMRFFSRANRFSRTVSGFAEYHATTRGTASQTIRNLVDRGYLARTPSSRDGRSVLFDLTKEGLRKLVADPLESLVDAAESLPDAQRSNTTNGLRALLAELENAAKCQTSIGRCALCGHLRAGTDSGGQCRLMQEPLRAEELDEICVRFDARD
ncbi:MAG: MarR family winged helix-turn-helix transcriptional regulator [Gammaproteobacteria bacterium]